MTEERTACDVIHVDEERDHQLLDEHGNDPDAVVAPDLRPQPSRRYTRTLSAVFAVVCMCGVVATICDGPSHVAQLDRPMPPPQPFEVLAGRLGISLPSSSPAQQQYSAVDEAPPEAELCERWAVLRLPSKGNVTRTAMRQLSKLEQWCTVVIGDEEDAYKYQVRGVTYLSPRDQDNLPYRITKLLPLHEFGRKSVGYLYAIHHGAKVIYDVNHDSSVLDPEGGMLYLERWFMSKPASTSASATVAHNPYPCFPSYQNAWPRGLPLDAATERDSAACEFVGLGAVGESEKGCSKHSVGVMQLLSNHEPDVDAVFCFSEKEDSAPFDGGDKTDYGGARREMETTIVPASSFMPYNAQATLHFTPAFWGMLLPVTVNERVSDIWRSYLTQTLLPTTGAVVAVTPARAMREAQGRDQRNCTADFLAERSLHEKGGALLRYLSKYQERHREADSDVEETLPSIFLPRRIEELAITMYEHGVVGNKDVVLAQAWIEDLLSVGHVFGDPNKVVQGEPRASGRAESTNVSPALGASPELTRGKRQSAAGCAMIDGVGVDDYFPRGTTIVSPTSSGWQEQGVTADTPRASVSDPFERVQAGGERTGGRSSAARTERLWNAVHSGAESGSHSLVWETMSRAPEFRKERITARRERHEVRRRQEQHRQTNESRRRLLSYENGGVRRAVRARRRPNCAEIRKIETKSWGRKSRADRRRWKALKCASNSSYQGTSMPSVAPGVERHGGDGAGGVEQSPQLDQKAGTSDRNKTSAELDESEVRDARHEVHLSDEVSAFKVGEVTELNPSTTEERARKPSVLLVIAVVSIRPDRRAAIRRSWLAWADERVILRFFTERPNQKDTDGTGKAVLLAAEARRYGDLVLLDIEPGMDFGLKLVSAMRHMSSAYNFDFFLRLDDDYFLCLRRLLNELEGLKIGLTHDLLYAGGVNDTLRDGTQPDSGPLSLIYAGHRYCQRGAVRVDEAYMLLSSVLVRRVLSVPHLQCSSHGGTSAGWWFTPGHGANPSGDVEIVHDPRLDHEGHWWTVHGGETNAATLASVCDSQMGIHHTYPENMARLWAAAAQYPLGERPEQKQEVFRYVDDRECPHAPGGVCAERFARDHGQLCESFSASTEKHCGAQGC